MLKEKKVSDDKDTVYVKEKDGEVTLGHNMKYYRGPKTNGFWFKIIETKQTEYGIGYICRVPHPVPSAWVEKKSNNR
jgi:hypothetical protein